MLRRIVIPTFIALLFCGVALGRLAWADPTPRDETVFLESVYDTFEECLGKGDYHAARNVALRLVESPRWKHGSVQAAGAIRGMADELRSRGYNAMADEITQAAAKFAGPTGDAKTALIDRRLSPTAIKSKPVFSVRVLAHRPAFSPAADLRLIRVGNQAAILKIMGPDGKPVFTKGIDGVAWAPILDEHRTAIFTSLGLSERALDVTALQLIRDYPRINAKKACIALIGVIGSTKGSAVTDGTRRKIMTFLVARMRDSWGGKLAGPTLRRQACLNLALQDSTDMRSISAVIDFYQNSSNLWETFPVQQFFEYHSEQIRRQAALPQIRARVAAIQSLYTDNILKFL